MDLGRTKFIRGQFNTALKYRRLSSQHLPPPDSGKIFDVNRVGLINFYLFGVRVIFPACVIFAFSRVTLSLVSNIDTQKSIKEKYGARYQSLFNDFEANGGIDTERDFSKEL